MRSRPLAALSLLLFLLGGLAPHAAHASQDGAPAASDARGAFFGARGDPGVQKGAQGLLVTEVVPGSPAEASGLQPGDLLIYLVRTDGPRDAYLKRPQVHARDQGALEAWLETQAPGLEVQAWALRNGRMLRNAVRLAPAPGAGAGPLGAGHAPGPMETAQKAYLQMCGKGDEKLGAATCASMKRDLDAALAREAAEAREAEVMALHRRLCAPDARKLSVETCAAMLTEAERTLAAAPALSPKDFSSASAKGASAPPARRGRGPSPAPP